MNKPTVQAFKSAIEAAGIETYAYVTDLPSFFYNNKENAVAIEDMDKEIIYCIKSNNNFGSGHYFTDSDLVILGAKFEDFHEVRFGANYQQAMTFVEALGLSLTDEQKALLLSVASSKRPIKPPTGDYTFKELTQEEYDALSPDEKEVYDKLKYKYMREKAGMSARQISVDVN